MYFGDFPSRIQPLAGKRKRSLTNPRLLEDKICRFSCKGKQYGHPSSGTLSPFLVLSVPDLQPPQTSQEPQRGPLDFFVAQCVDEGI